MKKYLKYAHKRNYLIKFIEKKIKCNSIHFKIDLLATISYLFSFSPLNIFFP